MKRKIAVLINPVAGKGKSVEILPFLKGVFDKNKDLIEASFSISKNKKDIGILTKNYVLQGYTEFIAVGGDGTLFDLINGLDLDEKHSFKIAMIPLGTGNDFVKSLGKNIEIDSIIKNILTNKTRLVDVGKVNDSYFMNSCTFGIDGPITQKTEQYKKVLPGKAAYLMSTIVTAMKYKSSKIKVTIDSEVIEKKILTLAVCNGNYIGGGMEICPYAKPDDQLLDICLIESVNPLKILKEVKKIYSGDLNTIDEVHYYKGRNVTVESLEGFVLINADGNIIGTDPASVSIHNKQIEVYN